MSSFISAYGGNMDARATGLQSIRRALDSGLTINQVRDQINREGVSMGPAARDFLNSRPSNSFVAKYGGNYDTMRNSGMQSVNRAMASGLSWEQVQQQAQQQGISWGTRAQDYFTSQGIERDRKAEEARKKAEFDRLNSFQQVNDSIDNPDSVYRTPEATSKSYIKRDYGSNNSIDYSGLQMKTPADAKKSNPLESLGDAAAYSNNYLQGKIDKFKSGFNDRRGEFGLNLKGGNRASQSDGGGANEEPWLQVRKMREDRRKGYGDRGNSFDRRD